MAGNVLLDAVYGTLTSAFVTADLDAKTTGSYALGSGAGATIDNTTALKLWIDVLINLGSITPTGAAYVTLSTLRSMDGTTFEDPQTAIAPNAGTPTWSQGVSTAAAAKVLIIRQILVPPGKCKLLFGNFTNVTLATGGNTIKYWLSGYQDNG